MLGTLTFISMRQKQSKPRQTAPLGFAGADELIDDDLCPVAEIAELTLPNRQAMRLGRRESVFESHDRLLGQYRVGHRERGLVGSQVLQRHVAPPRDLV